MIGTRLRELRTERELTQRDVATNLKLSSQAYSLYENEKRSPDYAILQKLATYFDVTISYLLGESDQRKPTPAQPNQILAFERVAAYAELNDEDQRKVEEYIELLKLKYKK